MATVMEAVVCEEGGLRRSRFERSMLRPPHRPPSYDCTPTPLPTKHSHSHRPLSPPPSLHLPTSPRRNRIDSIIKGAAANIDTQGDPVMLARKVRQDTVAVGAPLRVFGMARWDPATQRVVVGAADAVRDGPEAANDMPFMLVGADSGKVVVADALRSTAQGHTVLSYVFGTLGVAMAVGGGAGLARG